MISPQKRLVFVAVVFTGWMAWLGYAAVTKSRGPILSRAQAAATTHLVVAELIAGEEDRPAPQARVTESFNAEGTPPGTVLTVANLPETRGFEGPGLYLLMLAKDPAGGFYVVGPQRSPGYDLGGAGRPVIYKWSADVQAQAKRLFP